MSDYTERIAKALPESLNSQHRMVIAAKFARALEATAAFNDTTGAFITIPKAIEVGIQELEK